MGGDFTWNWRWLSNLVAGPRSQEVGKKWVSPTKYERFIKWNVHKRFQFKIFNVFPNQLASHWFPNCFPQLYLVVQFDSKIFWKYVFFLKTSINFFHVHLIYNFTWLALKSFPKRPWHMIQDYWTKLSSLSLCAAGQVHRYLEWCITWTISNLLYFDVATMWMWYIDSVSPVDNVTNSITVTTHSPLNVEIRWDHR